ncbi:ABC transporter permease [Heliorestis convoluta]|uniref:Glycine betaine transport system permease protein OpuAB n=1 Tax=Heliorestis convoluta TaxID=356322 RepID=A0A5Q2NAS1_9FIRM|nr:proline/glycine betaine ABC transporter permease [Heliorestis convoluta]QGG49360.1 glycine betaine transport system permease protein OpuAB [Heliorestis convoluta]
MGELLPKIPVDRAIEAVLDFFLTHFEGFFRFLSKHLENFVELLVFMMSFFPSIVLIAALAALAWYVRDWKFALFTGLGLLFIENIGYWKQTIDTLALVLTAVAISVLLGVPIGILSAQRDGVRNVVTPILDFMQTMPAFVYLIPAIFFFGLGVVPGIVASVIFAMPPTIRLTNLGIRQVPADLVEVSDAFGSTAKQKLLKVQLPLAMPTIMAGVNQSIMLALSMVVIASMIGAPGLGEEVYRAVTQLKIGSGFEAGLAIVVLAIVLDRFTQNIKKK